MVSTAVMADCPAKILQPSVTLHTKVHCHVPQLAPADPVCHFSDDGCLPRALCCVLLQVAIMDGCYDVLRMDLAPRQDVLSEVECQTPPLAPCIPSPDRQSRCLGREQVQSVH